MLTTRRDFLVKSALLACGLRGGRSIAQPSDQDVLVRTPVGPLRGMRGDRVRIFRGVPFAEPPIGPLRFRPTLPVKPWTATRDATQFAASPIQSGEPGIAHSEDCLYLNLWAPETEGPHPVFVWIHGGGFTGGHAFEPVYDGSQFAQEGIVCVTVAYRLGVFGFLDVEPLLGPGFAGSANNGLRDLIAALEWVRTNIASFGGDPARVTVGGESAGAKLTGILMGIPAAKGLFHQTISESGGAERVWQPNDATAVATAFGDVGRKTAGLPLASLLTQPADAILRVQRDFLEGSTRHFPLRPVLDGKLLTRLPMVAIATGTTRGKRLLIGTNRDESALFLGPRPLRDPIAKDLGNTDVAQFDQVFEQYPAIYPGLTPEQRRIQAVTAEEYWIPSIRLADAHVQAGGTAWMYRLDFSEASGRLQKYAYHSLDVGLVWDKPHAAVSNASAEASLAHRMHAAWCTFIRGDAPAAPGLPVWPEYHPETRATMILNDRSYVAARPQQAELELWRRFL